MQNNKLKLSKIDSSIDEESEFITKNMRQKAEKLIVSGAEKKKLYIKLIFEGDINREVLNKKNYVNGCNKHFLRQNYVFRAKQI